MVPDTEISHYLQLASILKRKYGKSDLIRGFCLMCKQHWQKVPLQDLSLCVINTFLNIEAKINTPWESLLQVRSLTCSFRKWLNMQVTYSGLFEIIKVISVVD